MGLQDDSHQFVPLEDVEPLLPQLWLQPLLRICGSYSSILSPPLERNQPCVQIEL